jgi:hypothetical protein
MDCKVYYQNKIMEHIAVSLNTRGAIIRTGEVWKSIGYMGYGNVQRSVKVIMDTMVEQGKAKRLSPRGPWEILKPNERQ